ncbi:glycosyltransferase family 2 protein [Myceligenerans halotolerans]
MAEHEPDVAVVACVRDEELNLENAVRSALGQDYSGKLDVVLAVGPSHDRTREIADKLAAEHPQVHVVDNPTGSRSIGLNLAFAAAPPDREIIVRVDGHTAFEPDYVRRGVAALLKAGAVGVGGLMSPSGQTPTQRAVARAMSHPVGLGQASFHVGGEAGPAETVYLGIFRRSAVDEVGGYDPTIFRAEDWELCLRLRRAGGLLWFEPSLVVTYWPRRTFGAVAKQFWRTGMWRREVVRREPTTASARYLAPPAALLALGVSVPTIVAGLLLGSAWVLLAGLVAPVTYAAVVLAGTAHAARRRPRLPLRSALLLPPVVVTMHMAWGAGFLRGLTARAAVDHRA